MALSVSCYYSFWSLRLIVLAAEQLTPSSPRRYNSRHIELILRPRCFATRDQNFPTDDRLDLSITVVTFPLTCIGMTVDKNHIKWWGNIGCCIKFYLHFFKTANNCNSETRFSPRGFQNTTFLTLIFISCSAFVRSLFGVHNTKKGCFKGGNGKVQHCYDGYSKYI